MSQQQTNTDVSRFVIDRQKWLRGIGSALSSLLNSEGKSCCLGFYAEACGFTKADISDILTPADLLRVIAGESVPGIDTVVSRDISAKWNTKLVVSHTTASIDHMEYSNAVSTRTMMSVNDDPFISDDEREKLLIMYFADINIQLSFIN